MIDRIILNIPYSSTAFPPGAKACWQGDIDAAIRRETAWDTGYLFATAAMKDPRIHPVAFPWSRFYCDVAQPEDDARKRKGPGIVYTRFGNCTRNLTDTQKEAIYRDCYLEHMASVMKKLTPTSLLIDCHSFPADVSDVDVCIALNSDGSVPTRGLLMKVKYFFRSRDYRTEYNDPFKGSYAPSMPFFYPSMRLAFNQRIYLTPDGKLDCARADQLRLTLAQLYENIMEPWVHEIFQDRFMLLYENRGVILKDPRMVTAPIGMEFFGCRLTLGAYLSALEAHGDLFLREEGVIIGFATNVYARTTTNTILRWGNPKGQRIRIVEEPDEGQKLAALKEAIQRFPSRDGALPLSIVVEMLEKGDY